MSKEKMLSIVVLISGNGSNLQAIIDAIQNGLPVKIEAVISNVETAYGLIRAKESGIPAKVINHKNFHNRDNFDAKLQEVIDFYQPDLIVLAGFMRKLGSLFVHHFKDRIINIHPSLLPKYPGLHTHRQVIANKDKEHGCTIHYVTEDLDAGPIIAQKKIAISSDDTESSLQDRVHELEHQLYPEVLGRMALLF